MNRREILHVLVASGALLATPVLRAQSAWPTRPVRVIVPFPPGGTMESVVRLLGQEIRKALGQPVIIENKPGAGTLIGVEAASRSTDGHTFGCVANSFAVNHTLVKKLPYDTLRDLQPVGLMAKTANVLAAHPSVPAATLQELVEYAKKNPGKLAYASFGNGTTAHFAGETLKMMAGIDLVHVPYKGQAPALTDLIAGQVNLMFGNLPEFLPQIRAGRLRAYGTTYLERAALAPDLPTIAEQGYAGFYTDSWYGVVASASVPKEIIARMNAEINRTLTLSEVRDALVKRGLDPIPSTPEHFGEFIRSEIAKYAKIVKDAGIKID